MKILLSSITLLLVILAGTVQAGQQDMKDLGAEVIQTAFSKLRFSRVTAANIACLTNAGYVQHKGKNTLMLYDVLQDHTGISLGRGNLLPMYSGPYQPLWFAFVYKRMPGELLLTYVVVKEEGAEATKPINIYVHRHQSFAPFTELLGEKALPIITMANGWADGMPEDLLQGALYHDQFCRGVLTGYFTARFIQKHFSLITMTNSWDDATPEDLLQGTLSHDHFCSGAITGYLTARFILNTFPLRKGEQYTYIGVPGWCRDDYLLHYLNLSPGERGYYLMSSPKPWLKTKQKEKNDGIVIRFNSQENTGQAAALRFDRHEDAFREFIGEPKLELDWKKEPWLHVWYNRFFLSHRDEPKYFVSVVKTKDLESKEEFEALVAPGTNPLEVIIGENASRN
ncbi:MAG: FmdE family protein [Candidatus Electrothrix sp. GW3-4]|uniref:FmdE family protein n=1 Tax=Candidatus Electrothrix sp. GW3-4 TaxID=3126740 RepID=UPI0030CF8176